MKNRLIILFLIFFIGCNHSPKISSINLIEFQNLDCLNPPDGIIKFKTINENGFGKIVIDFLDKKGVEINQENSDAINDWCKNKIFGLLNSKQEWQLYDKEFCETEITQLLNDKDDILFNSQVWICNSYLNDDSSVGGNWWLYLDDYELNIMTCNQIEEQVGFVPYYEVTKKDNGEYELSLKRDMMKYYVSTNLMIECKNADESILIRDTLIKDKGILYSGFINSLKKETEKIPKKEKEEKLL